MSLPFFVCCLFGEDSFLLHLLLDSFYKYVSKDEYETIKKYINDDDVSERAVDQDVLDFLNSYKYFHFPRKEAMPKIIVELAYQEIIQKPKYISNVWSPIITKLKKYDEFQNIENLKEMYLSKHPTASRSLSCSTLA